MSRERTMKALNEFLRPEFINRVDEVICFNQLTEENFRAIAGLMLGELRDVMKENEHRPSRGTTALSTTSSKRPTPSPTARATCAALFRRISRMSLPSGSLRTAAGR